MSRHEKRHGTREAKKPKKPKEKAVATADSLKDKAPLNIGKSRK
jgi:hypothetical protein